MKNNEDGQDFSEALAMCSPHCPGLVNILCVPKMFQYQVLCLGPPVASQAGVLTHNDHTHSQELLFLDPLHGIVITPREFSGHGFLEYRTAKASRPAHTSAYMLATVGLFLALPDNPGDIADMELAWERRPQ